MDLTLFFQQKAWTDLVPAYGDDSGKRVPLWRRVSDRHAGALRELSDMARQWDALEGDMQGDERWAGVKARFAQQVHDAAVMCEQILSWYAELSGLPFSCK